MKNLWLHGIYLTIIGILCFQLWSKTAANNASFKQFEQVFNNEYVFLNAYSIYFFNEIDKQYKTNPSKYEKFRKHSENIFNASKLITSLVSIDSVTAKLKKSTDLNKIRDSLVVFSNNLFDIPEKQYRSKLMEECGSDKLIKNDIFWKNIDANLIANLQLIKNQIKIDELAYLGYLHDKVNGRIQLGCENCFRVAIAPNKGVLISGEKLEADIYLGKYESYPNEYLTIVANDQILPIKDGVAHYSITEENIGLKRIKAQISIYNPFTGATKIIKNEFEYHVLPKCSKNCQ